MNEDLTKWVDRQLSDEELTRVEAYLANEPDLLAQLNGQVKLGEVLREVAPSEVEPPYPDFFNARLMREIQREDVATEPVAAPKSSLIERLRWWFMPVLAGSMALAFVAGMQTTKVPAASGGEVAASDSPTVYSALASLDTNVVTSQDHELSLIVVDGLNELPADIDLSLTESRRDLNSSYSVASHTSANIR